MRLTVILPGYLQQFAEGRASVDLDAELSTVADAIRALGDRYPGVVHRMLNEQGAVRQHVNVFVDEVNIRETGGLTTPVPDGCELFILGAVSGG